jgi:hypothetical protein
MTVNPAVLTELGKLRVRLPELTGSVLATADGMVVAHDAHGIEPDSLAALAAAHLALARRFAHAVRHGELRESVVQGTDGYITSYAAGAEALLTVVTNQDANLARVHLEARRTVTQLRELLALERPEIARPHIPAQATPATPLARRTPMATLPTSVRHPQAAG